MKKSQRKESDNSKNCRNCGHAKLVTDRWLESGTGLPTLSGCPFMEYRQLAWKACPCGKWELKTNQIQTV